MKLTLIILSLFLLPFMSADAQKLTIKKRAKNALSGTEFIAKISDSTLSIIAREAMIFEEIKKGNIPKFLRKLRIVKDSLLVNDVLFTAEYWVTPDYISIGSDEDYFYCPMTPMLAQQIANLLDTSLPTKKMVDRIYRTAAIKLEPKPIPPTKEMITVKVFGQHNEIVREQLSTTKPGQLTAGNKKDIIISNKIYGEKTPRVVIYGWHKMNGKAIQPVYNKHTNTWADYSHGVRLIAKKLYVNGDKVSIESVLSSEIFSGLLSDEGVINKPRYPIE